MDSLRQLHLFGSLQRTTWRASLPCSLLLGLEVDDLVLTSAGAYIAASRRAEETAIDAELARRSLRAVFRAPRVAPPRHWRLNLRDGFLELWTEASRQASAEHAAAVSAVLTWAHHLAETAERFPERPWQRGVRQSWQEVAQQLGASFDPRRLELHLAGAATGQLSAWVQVRRAAVFTVFSIHDASLFPQGEELMGMLGGALGEMGGEGRLEVVSEEAARHLCYRTLVSDGGRLRVLLDELIELRGRLAPQAGADHGPYR